MSWQKVGQAATSTLTEEVEDDGNINNKRRWTLVQNVARVIAWNSSRKVEVKESDTDPFLQRFTSVATGLKNKKHFKYKSFFTWKLWSELVINPADWVFYKWSEVVAVAIYYNIIVIIVRSVFQELHQSYLMPMWFVMDYTCDLIYIFDGFIRSRLGFLEQGILVTDVKILTCHYLMSRRFFLDFISVIPLEILYIFVEYNSFLRLNRVIKVTRLGEFYQDSQTRTNSPTLFRLTCLIVNIVIVIHWNACIFYAFSALFGFNSDGWVYAVTKKEDMWFAHKYLACFYWSMLTLTAIGDTPPPERVEALLYATCCTLCGVLIFATIFGNIGIMINQMNATRQQFEQDLDSVKRYMAIRKVSPFLQERVFHWFTYQWKNNKQSVDDGQALAVLPEKLRAEIAIYVHLDTLKRVALFKDCEPGLLIELVLKLRLQVISPGDFICRKGEVGKEMYIVKRGKLIVLSEDGEEVLGTLEDGAVFGEISILNIKGNRTGNRRTCHVRSVGYSDLFYLSKVDLWQALSEYPSAKRMLQERGRQMLKKDHLLDEKDMAHEDIIVPMEERVLSIAEQLSVVNAKMDAMADRLNNLMPNHGRKYSTVGRLVDKATSPVFKFSPKDSPPPKRRQSRATSPIVRTGKLGKLGSVSKHHKPEFL
ncbi:cyclic nucleotide-gated cation channel alpha-3-like [Gigantopelta aegis]|uniref:cyclic nucleotide-gated cation channel alpha-3-like n=1 Tax=Gigantopelta aegis TaxID=1735272 RepID=UPI001B88B180|nr:cyclic nucleotide-gated cation channel alpha-3-like [Gigantopelta aegis]